LVLGVEADHTFTVTYQLVTVPLLIGGSVVAAGPGPKVVTELPSDPEM